MKTLVLTIRVRRRAGITRPVTWKPFKFGVGSLYAQPAVALPPLPVNQTPAPERVAARRSSVSPVPRRSAPLRPGRKEDQPQQIR